MTKETPIRKMQLLAMPTAPHSVEAEMGTIGSILSEASLKPNEPPVAILEAQAQVSPAHFYIPANRMIWETLCEMFDEKKPLDFIAVTQELRDQKKLDAV